MSRLADGSKKSTSQPYPRAPVPSCLSRGGVPRGVADADGERSRKRSAALVVEGGYQLVTEVTTPHRLPCPPPRAVADDVAAFS